MHKAKNEILREEERGLKMKKKNLLRVISCMLIMILLMPSASSVLASEMGDSAKKITMKVYEDEIDEIELKPGETTHVKIPIQCDGDKQIRAIPSVTLVDGSSNSNDTGIKVKGVKLTRPNSKDEVIRIFPKAQCMTSGPTYVEFDVVTKETVKIGHYFAKISFNNPYEEMTFNNITIPFAVNDELEDSELIVSAVDYETSDAIVGNDLTLKLKIKNEGGLKLKSAYFTVDYPKNAEGKYEINKNYSSTKINLGSFGAGDIVPVTLPVKILSAATADTKSLTLNFTYKNVDGDEKKTSTTIYVDVLKNTKAPELSIVDTSISGDARVGKSFDAIVSLKNKGNSQAENIKVSVTDGIAADSILPNYSTGTIAAGSIKKGASSQVTIPLKVSADATKGTKAVTVVVSYEDAYGAKYETKTVIYPVVKVNKEVKKKEGTPDIIIRNVTQSPLNPKAGERVTMNFEIKNTGSIDVSEFKIGPSGIAANTFSPVELDPYIYVNKLKSGATKQVSLAFDISEKITEGYNTIPLSYSYKYGDAGTEGTSTVTLNVNNVIAKKEDDLSKSVPKVIISNYSTSIVPLKSGEKFVFNYTLENTHKSVDATNIKVKISQAENMFTVTGGSNSTYIDKIEAGTSKECSIELQVKADATTKSYPLSIDMEYEYEGAQASPTTGKIGETVSEAINLSVVENTRAELNGLRVDESDPLMVGSSGYLLFDFYNMGKSPINNVYATVSGDFAGAEGEKQIIGNVAAGECKSIEMMVSPSMEGDCTGTLTVYYEDSTGEKMSMSQDFTGYVQPAGGFDPGMDMPMMPEESTDTAKKPILPVWAFVLIQVAILLVGTLVARAIKIKRYKKKLERAEEVE